jgi:hypothetical protein
MTLSGSYDFDQTAMELYKDALYNIQAIPIGHTPQAKDVEICQRALNRLIKSLQNEHIFLNAVTLRNFNTVAETISYQLETGTKKVIGTPYIKIDGNDTPLNVISRQDYDSITTKAGTGQPSDIFIDYDTSPPTAYLYPSPASIYAVYYRSEDVLDDIDESSNTVNMPSNALDMLLAGLSYELCKPYRQTTSFRQEIGEEFKVKKRQFKGGDIARDGDDKVAPYWVV